MKLSVDEMMTKAETFIQSHIIPNLKTDKSRFLVGFASISIRAKLRKTLEGLAEAEDGGLIDIEKLRECVKNGFDLAGSVLLDERLPLRFTQEDADLFFATFCEAEKTENTP